ncbi:deoxyribose-phosphate aldolase 2 [Cordyceps fumosorosea ARSEF 2679]|uniref:Deoxyribose-phosphate aldolase 2 n=1 Tax=Cordyceps fumosorosea (strain ARSEF 2679) TaxID=1081104 RepID=A0A167TK31_CORFA|nr:deoxyribose-phosphate aldolase 2 [Cordyceps fumosorosea ARSEF 2679]OAA60681.1 deoxyribose-phosphate aldolase 2 [Cordyceps fumosorosea ARSEF 2679]
MHAEGNPKTRSFSEAFAANGSGGLQSAAAELKRRRVAEGGGVTLPLSTGKLAKSFTPTRGGRSWTVSVAIPGSIIKHLPTAEQRLATVARLARTLTIFCVDEVVVFNDEGPSPSQTLTLLNGSGVEAAYTGDSDPCHFVAQVLSFLDCPPFMRRRLFPLHANLRHTALLPALDAPHHPRAKAPWLPYAEGVTVEEEEMLGEGGSLVDTGIGGIVRVAETIPPNTRVTLQLDDQQQQGSPPVCVHPEAPRTRGGYYWGYAVRRAAGLSAVFTECPREGGYDLSVGTSERGAPLSQALAGRQQRRQQQQGRQSHGHHHHRRGGEAQQQQQQQADSVAAPSFRHLVVVFGGPRGLEHAADRDPSLAAMHIRGPRTRELFDEWVDVLPHQGSRVIATDEAVPIALMGLQGLWEST